MTPQWKQASLPAKEGGLSTRRAADLALPAFLAPVCSSRDLTAQLLRHFDNVPIYFGNCNFDAWLRLSNLTTLPTVNKQKAWDAPLVKTAQNTLLLEPSDDRERARLLAAMSKHSACWLDALPSSAIGLLLTPDQLRIGIANRLGLKVCTQHTCPCGANVDSTGVHGLSCRLSAGRQAKHKMVNEELRCAMVSAGVGAKLEPQGLMRSDGRRPDGLSNIPWANGKQLHWNFTCADTLALSHLPSASTKAGAAAEKQEASKRTKYAALLNDYIFQPIAIETLGSLGPETITIMKVLCKRLINSTGDLKSGAYFRQRVSIAIIRCNAICVQVTLLAGEGLFEDCAY